MYKVTRVKKHEKIRKKIMGTKECPRLAVFRSSQHIYAQIIDDSQSKTLVSISDLKETGTKGAFGTKKEKAFKVGKNLAEKALKNKIITVVFDRGGFLYQGRIAELAKGAREGGLKF
ncbi:MAG: 50S ribosomal protein L18 [Candidatus Daviesbacteria bacterium]|nr:50S ribosomal protein L18 [Candidatus Daviesbacteria bacterium]